MTTDRKYADPVEEVARALGGSRLWPVVFEAGSATALAKIAIHRLGELGFLNDHFYDAIKEQAKEKQG